jgi:hypothetical protein
MSIKTLQAREQKSCIRERAKSDRKKFAKLAKHCKEIAISGAYLIVIKTVEDVNRGENNCSISDFCQLTAKQNCFRRDLLHFADSFTFTTLMAKRKLTSAALIGGYELKLVVLPSIATNYAHIRLGISISFISGASTAASC